MRLYETLADGTRVDPQGNALVNAQIPFELDKDGRKVASVDWDSAILLERGGILPSRSVLVVDLRLRVGLYFRECSRIG